MGICYLHVNAKIGKYLPRSFFESKVSRTACLAMCESLGDHPEFYSNNLTLRRYYKQSYLC